MLEGQLFDHYLIVRCLKSGGMGEIYLADDTHHARQVAIKVIRSDTTHNSAPYTAQEAMRLFLHEAQAIARLDHLHILPLFHSGKKIISGIHFMYMAMPYRHEGSLDEWLRNHHPSSVLSPREVERIVSQAASALQHAHDQKIIHRDVKPSNFLIQGDADRVSQLNLQLADFGVAKFMSTTSETQVVRGTPGYMAPEQWEGRSVAATDQYALAVMVYELLTGRLPYAANNHQQMWHQHRFVDPPPPSSINPDIPQEIDSVLFHALSKNPADRFGSIEIFARAFRQALRQSGDIYHTLHISIVEARNGTSRAILLPGRRKVIVPVPPGVFHGQVLRLEGQGNPSGPGGSTGALIISIEITDVPDIATVAYVPSIERTAPAALVNNDVQFDDQQHSRNRGRMLFKTLLALILIVASTGIFYTTWLHQQDATRANDLAALNSTHTAIALNSTANARNTASANTTSTVQTNATAVAVGNINATTTAVANASATAQAKNASSATATAQVLQELSATATAYAINEHVGPQVLNDQLQQNSSSNWDTSTVIGGGGCFFKDGAYHSSMPQANTSSPCFAQSTSFSDCSYEVQMTITQGDQGGIIFRGNKTDGTFYYFYINTSGSFALETVSHYNITGIIASGTSTAIKKGLNQPNLILVVAHGSTITVLVNMQPVTAVSDSTYSQGEIGVVAENTGDPTEVVFSNAKAWTYN
ncbi:MAG: hypothetical protein NVSMB33_12110 [Ktedonobacteraceae bacterium]